MNTESQIEQKKTRKYRKISRVLQAKILQEAPKMSQRQLAQIILDEESFFEGTIIHDMQGNVVSHNISRLCAFGAKQ